MYLMNEGFCVSRRDFVNSLSEFFLTTLLTSYALWLTRREGCRVKNDPEQSP
jgi:hypothetical protein